MQNHNLASCLFRHGLQAFAQIQFLARVKFSTESADLPKHCCLHEDERPGHPATLTAFPIPDARDEIWDAMVSFQSQSASASKTSPGSNLFGDFREEFCAGFGIRVHEEQPLAAGCCCAGVSCAANLVHWLEHHRCASRPCDFRRVICGVVVADDEFGFKASALECTARFVDAGQ